MWYLVNRILLGIISPIKKPRWKRGVQKVLAGLKPLVIMNHTSFSAKCRWVFRSINNKIVISFNYITIAYFPQFTQSTSGICRLNLGNAIATLTLAIQGGGYE
jgi:hypothetical protein